MRLISVNPNSLSPQLGFLPRDWRLGVSSRHIPMQNHLLAALPAADYERLLPALELVPLRLGWAIYEAGGRLGYVYFPTNGIVSLLYVMENGASAGTAITGSEGCIGIASIMGGDSTPIRTIVQSAGFAYRLKAEVVKKEFERGGPLQHLLLRYTQALLTQIAQTAACNRHHLLEQQLCRLLLLCLDRLSSSELTMTQELIAYMLGVRREGVTAAASKLQKDGLIDYRRGHITVIDRPKLETRVCECYAVVKRELERLLPATTQADAPATICGRRALSTVR
jgi:CRP-like cAMP-binding protein